MIELNGRPLATDAGHTLLCVLEELGLPFDGPGIAIAVDAEVIPRGEWGHFVVHDGARVELVQAARGG